MLTDKGRQVLAGLGLLVLAGEPEPLAPLPGATIAQQAAAAKPGAAAGAGHAGPPKKVASPKGEAFYKVPIGSLIIPHPQHAGGGKGEHFVKGQPSHFIHNTTEAKWVANQWKDHPQEADKAAHEAVESGTHRWVQSGEHEFAVHKDIDVHVPKSTDVHNPAAVKQAPKAFVKKDEHGEPGQTAVFHPDHPEHSAAQAVTQSAKDILAQHWKKLPEEPPKKAVSFAGKHAAWVPHDWQVHKATSADEGTLLSKWAKDPEGTWHEIQKNGLVQKAPLQHEVADWAHSGAIEPDKDQPEKHAPLPVAGESQPGKLKAEVAAKEGPPLSVTAEEVQHALKILQDDKSTAVKQPLAKAGHPLAAMDYHQIAKEELAKHPELKVSPGTKKEHVGQVKLAVIHHLAGRVAHLAHSQAGAEALEAAQDKAQADAEYAAQLTPHTTELPTEKTAPGPETVPVYVHGQKVKDVPAGSQVYVWHMHQADKATAPKYVKFPDGSWHYYDGTGKFEDLHGSALAQQLEDYAAGKLLTAEEESKPDYLSAPKAGGGYLAASKEDVQAAVDALTAAKSTAIKQVLKAKGSPLAEVDYWAVIHAYEKDHPNTAPKAKGTKQQHVGNAKQLFIAALQEKADLLAKADAATGHDQYAELYDLAANGKLKMGWSDTKAGALTAAAKKATDMEAPYYAHPFSGKWAVTVVKPDDSHYYKVTPQLLATDETGASAQTLLWNAAHLWLEPAKPEHEYKPVDAEPESPSAFAGHLDAAALAKKEWKADPQWKQIHAKVEGAYAAAGHLYSKAEATTLAQHIAKALAFALDLNNTEYVTSGKGWGITSVKPAEGTYAAAASLFYEVTPDHQVILHSATGDQMPLAHSTVLSYLLAGLKPEKAPEPEKPAPKVETFAEALGEDKPQGVPAIENGVYAGEFPAGSELYVKTGSYAGSYARDPSGQWWHIASYGGITKVKEAPGYMVSDAKLGTPELVPQAKPTPAGIAHAKDVAVVLAAIKTGTADASGAAGSTGQGAYATEKIFPTWQQAAVFALATGHKASGTSIFVIPDGSGSGFRYSATIGTAADEHYLIDSSALKVSYSPAGKEEKQESPALQKLLLAQVKAQVVPGAVTVEGKIYGFGYWKNPKGKSSLLIKPNSTPGYAEYWKYGTAAHAEYVYFDSNGTAKDVTPNFAAKQLAKATDFSAQPFPAAEVPVSKFAHATVLAPGSYHSWSSDELAPSSTVSIDVKPDGSANVLGNGSPYVLAAMTVDGIVKGGTLLDEHGTTVVKPGIQPKYYHIWGSKAKSKADVQELVSWLDENPAEQWAPKVKDFLAGMSTVTMDSDAEWQKIIGYGKAFGTAHNVVDGASQRKTFTALLKELLAVPQLPEGTQVGNGEEGPAKAAKTYTGPVFLKSLPPGITEAKDLFTFIPKGWAVPYQGGLAAQVTGAYTKPELKSKIQEISQEFGGGLVVGTHLSALPVSDLVMWLQAWQNGNMETVFELDAKGGKVSPAHPGAPDNAATHKITWAPADPNQVPASEDIPGPWSNLEDVSVLPDAEVSNYLIKMGFQHAEYLYATERQTVVRAHRLHQQPQVDTLTKTASQRAEAGQTPYSEPPAWTDGLKPAKPYDAYLASGEPAANWTTKAVEVFVKDHKPEVMPYIENIAKNNGYSADYLLAYGTYYLAQAVQPWLDNEHAKEVAEQSVPVWKKVPTGDLPSHGHEVWKATRTIPYTGAVTTWFVKPAPDGKVFRLEQEHAANLLGRVFGFGTAESKMLDAGELDSGLSGELVQAQKAIPGTPLGHYTDMPPWSSFKPQGIADIAAEHLLDWVLANDDTSANNMIQKPDGHIAGIDKGRSWGDMNWQGLAGTAAMDSMTQLVYTKLYDAVRNHQITKDAADQAYKQVIQRARRMAAVPDSRVQGILDAGFAHRTKWGEFGSRQGLIDEVLRRKNSLEDDFAKLWSQVYQDAGLGELPEVPAAKLPDAHGAPLHSGFSEPEFGDHVVAGKSHGVPAFFGGAELRDMHVLVWQQKTTSGGTTTHGETFVQGSAYSSMVDWLKGHTGKGTEAATAGDDTVSYPGDQFGPGKPPGGAPDRGDLSGEREMYTAIIRAARSATKHKSDGDYSKASSQAIWTALESAQQKLAGLKTGAEAVISANPEPGTPGAVSAVQQAKNLLDMTTLYLAHAAKVAEARQGAYGFSEGDLPRWLPLAPAKKAAPQDELSALGIKLVYGASASHEHGSLAGDGTFKPGGGIHTDPGSWWRMTLPDGEVIELGDGDSNGVELSHHGRIRFRTSDHSAASLERIRAALQLTGLNLREAETHDFERYYWQHLLANMADRVDSAKQPVWAALKSRFQDLALSWPSNTANHPQEAIDALAHLGETDPEGEMKAYRAAFATLTSPEQVQEWADKGGFFPRQKHFDPSAPEVAGGKPDWYRFDLAAKVKDLPMPIRQSSNISSVADNVVKNGGTYGKDALMRVAGTKANGMGNPYTSGGPAFVFTRLNVHESRAVVMTPLALARSHNYSFEDDAYGEWKYRSTQAHWNHAVWSNYTGGSNETMVSDAMSLLDDVELVQAYTEDQRNELISWLKARGIYEIRHMPVEDRVVKAINSTSVAKVKANYAAHPELLDPLAEHGLPYAGTTEAEVQPAESGKAAAEQAAAPPNTGTVSYSYPDGGTVELPADWTVYKSSDAHSSDAGKLWAKDPQGNWWFVDAKNGGTPVENNHNTQIHNEGVQNGGFVPADQAGGGAAAVSDLLGSVLGASLGPEWKASSSTSWYNDHYLIQKDAAGFEVYKGNSQLGYPEHVGSYGSIAEAEQAANGEGPPF